MFATPIGSRSNGSSRKGIVRACHLDPNTKFTDEQINDLIEQAVGAKLPQKRLRNLMQLVAREEIKAASAAQTS